MMTEGKGRAWLMGILITVLVVLLILLNGCATTSMEVAENGVIKWSSKTLFKDIKDADVEWGDFSANLGSSDTNEAAGLTVAEMAGLMKFMYQMNTGEEP